MKAVLFGVGETGRQIARNLDEKGVSLVGVFSRTSGVGEEVGSYLGVSGAGGVSISADPAAELPGCGGDVAILATGSTLAGQIPLASLALDAGMDVLSLAEEGFHPGPLAEEGAAHLDRLARRAGRTVFFGGIQDAFWHAAPLTLMAGVHTIRRLRGSAVSNLSELGAQSLAGYPLGLDPEQFVEATAGPETSGFTESIMGPSLAALVDRLGLEVAERTDGLEPILAAEDSRFSDAGMSIAKGTTRGFLERTIIATTAGPAFEAAFVSKLFAPGEEESIAWTVEGEPCLELRLDRFPAPAATAAALVNRIPSVIAADPGLRGVADLPAPTWWAGVDVATAVRRSHR